MKAIFILAGVILMLVALGNIASIVPQSIAATDQVWCSEWISIGCGIKQEANKAGSLSTSASKNTAYFTCGYDKGCVIETVSAFDIGNAVDYRCVAFSLKKGPYTLLSCSSGFNCPTKAIVTSALTNQVLVKGETISTYCQSGLFASGASYLGFNFTGKRLRLAYCSSGPTATSCNAGISGVEILGADGCHYNVGSVPGATDPAVLDQSGNKIGTGQSYLVPEGSNVWIPNPTKQYVCGTVQSQCDADTDCHYRYPFSWPLTSGLGNADIIGGKVVVYGCAATGPEACVKWSGPTVGSGTCITTVRTNRCAIVQDNVYAAECNPLTSTCGSNAFCDPKTLKCVSTGTVQCNTDRDPVCGTTIQCDRATKSLKEPFCQKPGATTSFCDFRTVGSVECCGSSDCTPGYYCTSSHQCKLQEIAIQDCPWACCEGDATVTGYWPNVPSGMHCCPDHGKAVSNLAECNAFMCLSDNDCLKNETCKDGKCVPATLCEERAPVPPFIVGWRLVIVDTPVYLIPFPFGGGLIETGRTTTETCMEVWNLPVIIGIILAFVLLASGMLFFKKRGPGSKTRKRRRKR